MRFFCASVRLCVCASLFVAPATLRAQNWDATEARELLVRAVGRRSAAFADSSLQDWSARAHGFVFFLGQIGEGLAEPPRLVKADQLELQVYWRLPNQSKQRIIGWRDQRDLPTDINYHRDHLGIAMGNFPDLIRLGEGDEVRDVPHPVSERGAAEYEYALGDTLTITLSDRELRVAEVQFRPKDFRAPRIVGKFYVEIGAADLVRMSFSFTRAAYIDTQLEDITVGIENSLLGGRWWLPVRQEIEIRRRATFLDFPARGIIRGRFEIDGYQFNAGLDPALFSGSAEIVAAPAAVRDTFPWRDSLSVAIQDVARPFALQDFDEVRAQATSIAMGHVLTGLRQNQLAAGSISDFVHVNRVEGLALGVGAAFRSANTARELRLRVGVATASGLVSGGAAFQVRRGRATWRLAGGREVRDVGDIPVISRAVNSITSQEGGQDYGDYYLATGGTLGVTAAVGGRTTLRLEGGYEQVDSLRVEADWARGAYARPNVGVGEGGWTVARLVLKRRTPSFAVNRDFSGRVEIEGGFGPRDYLRVFTEVRWQMPAGATSFLVRAAVGDTPYGALPDHRAFVLGGRGTVLGEPFRGRRGAELRWASAEWQVPVKIPEIRMGSFAGTGRRLTVAPNVAIGSTGGAVTGTTTATGADVSVGLGVSWLHDLLRFDAGYGISSHRFGFAVDVSRSFWDIL